jgi:hypothetical protein
MFDIELKDVVAKLREELIEAQAAADKEGITFALGDIDVEFQVVVTKQGGSKAGIKFWLVDAAADARIGSASTQKIKFQLFATDENNDPIHIRSRRPAPRRGENPHGQ